MDLRELRRLAAREGISLNYVAKDEKVSDALKQLEGHEELILKGGTAINRSYLKNKRFSEDIDFDIISENPSQKADAIAGSLKGFEVSGPRRMGKTIRYDLYYVNPLNHRDRIMLEFNPVKTAVSFGKRIVNFGFVPHEPALLNVYNLGELISMKSLCIKSRSDGKDFFDLYYLLDLPHEHGRLDKKGLLEGIARALDSVKELGNATNHYIPKDSRPLWEAMLGELKEKVEKY
jgi:uncharacterized protein